MNLKFETIYLILFRPQETLEINREKRSLTAALVMSLALANSLCATYLTEPYYNEMFHSKTSALLWFVIYCSWYLLLWAAVCSAIHFTAENIGGKGTLSDLMHDFAMALSPYILLTPFALLALDYTPLSTESVFSVVSAILMIWSFYIKLNAVRINYNFTMHQAILAFLSPLALVALAGLSMIVALNKYIEIIYNLISAS